MLNKEFIEELSNYVLNKNRERDWIPLFFNHTIINDTKYNDIVISSSFDEEDELRSHEIFFSERIPSHLREKQYFSPIMEYLKKMRIKPSIYLSEKNSITQEYLDKDDNIVAKLSFYPEDPSIYLFLMTRKHLLKIIKRENIFLKVYILITDEQLKKHFIDNNLFGLSKKNEYILEDENSKYLMTNFNVCLNHLLTGN